MTNLTPDRRALRDLRRSGLRAVLVAGALVGALSASTEAQSGGAEGGEPTSLRATRAERLLEGRLACRGCHVIRGTGGAIGPPLDGIGTRATRAHVLASIRDPSTTLPGTIMPLQLLASRESELLADYLVSLPATPAAAEVEARAPQALDPGRAPDGAALYARHCAACHGDRGGGDGWNAPALPVAPTRHADAALMSRRPDDTLYDAISAGGWVLAKSARMPAFGQMLDADQIRALVAHIRTLCECTQPSWAGPGL